MARTREKFDAPWYAKFAFESGDLCVLVSLRAAKPLLWRFGGPMAGAASNCLGMATPMILGRDLTLEFVGVSATAYEICVPHKQGLRNISVAILDSPPTRRGHSGDLRLWELRPCSDLTTYLRADCCVLRAVDR